MFCAQNQDVVPISSYDTAGSFLILGCNNGSIYYIGESHTWTWRPLVAACRITRAPTSRWLMGHEVVLVGTV